MTPINWFPFKCTTPRKNHAVMVEDHEGNMSPGVWRDGFLSFEPIPIGHLVKWTYIKVKILPLLESSIVDTETIWFESGESVKLSDIYDFEAPFKDIQK